jgi:GNAT superfamily N-acetyltransferase
MSDDGIQYSERRDLPREQVLALYRAVAWSAARKPEPLLKGLSNSDSLITAWDEGRLVGLGNAISDGHLVVYYPHLLVRPDYQGKGVGSKIVRRLMEKYSGFHQQMVVADGKATEFYRKCGFRRAGRTESMWIYAGQDH